MGASESSASVRARLSAGSPNCFAASRTPKISGREGVGVAKTTHGDDLGRPRTDTGQCRQLFPGAVPVATGM